MYVCIHMVNINHLLRKMKKKRRLFKRIVKGTRTSRQFLRVTEEMETGKGVFRDDR